MVLNKTDKQKDVQQVITVLQNQFWENR